MRYDIVICDEQMTIKQHMAWQTIRKAQTIKLVVHYYTIKSYVAAKYEREHKWYTQNNTFIHTHIGS